MWFLLDNNSGTSPAYSHLIPGMVFAILKYSSSLTGMMQEEMMVGVEIIHICGSDSALQSLVHRYHNYRH